MLSLSAVLISDVLPYYDLMTRYQQQLHFVQHLCMGNMHSQFETASFCEKMRVVDAEG
jgi:hypothetical protein